MKNIDLGTFVFKEGAGIGTKFINDCNGVPYALWIIKDDNIQRMLQDLYYNQRDVYNIENNIIEIHPEYVDE